jgi:S-adenosylmethionine decarboxylase
VKPLARHFLIEFYGVSPEKLDDLEFIKNTLHEAANLGRATILKSVFHKFTPQGVSGVLVIAESHFSVHTWPEYRYAAIDFFGCGEKLEFEKVIECLTQKLKAKSVLPVELKRGLVET